MTTILTNYSRMCANRAKIALDGMVAETRKKNPDSDTLTDFYEILLESYHMFSCALEFVRLDRGREACHCDRKEIQECMKKEQILSQMQVALTLFEGDTMRKVRSLPRPLKSHSKEGLLKPDFSGNEFS